MKNIIKLLFFLLVVAYGCTNSSSDQGTMIEAVFHPGFVEDCSHLDFPLISNDQNMVLNFKITASEYTYIADILRNKRIVSAKVLCDYKIRTKKNIKTPCVFIKLDADKYVLGNNGVVKDTKEESFVVSDLDIYRIKSILHYYDFFYEEDLDAFPEVRKYGIPANYQHIFNRKMPPAPFVKVVLTER